MITTESKQRAHNAAYMRDWRAKNREKARALSRKHVAAFRAKSKTTATHEQIH